MESWNSVSLYSTVLCQNTECCYLIICIEHGSLETSVHLDSPSVYYSSTVFVFGLFTCSNILTTVFWTHDVATSFPCFLNFQG